MSDKMMNTPYPVRRLDRDDFAAALRKGLGRASQHVQHYGLDDVAGVVLDACLHYRGYDGSMSKWLFQLYADTPHAARFDEAILASLETASDIGDAEQLLELAKEMALRGDKSALSAIRNRVLAEAKRPFEEGCFGGEEWIELAGVTAILDLARAYGRRLLDNPEDEPYVYLHSGDEARAMDAMRRAAAHDPEIKAYWGYLIRSGIFNPPSPYISPRERFRSTHTLESILDNAANHVAEYPGRYASFGHYATPEELELVFSRLLVESDPRAQLCLLRVFSRAAVPRLDDLLFMWANGDDDGFKFASLRALRKVTDLQVHQLARAKLRAGKLLRPDSEVLELFIKNYDGGDAELIAGALAAVSPDVAEAHSLAWGVIDVAKEHKDARMGDALRWAYENTPCSNCRHRVVGQLDVVGQFEGELLFECQFDAEEDTRALALKRLAERNST